MSGVRISGPEPCATRSMAGHRSPKPRIGVQSLSGVPDCSVGEQANAPGCKPGMARGGTETELQLCSGSMFPPKSSSTGTSCQTAYGDVGRQENAPPCEGGLGRFDTGTSPQCPCRSVVGLPTCDGQTGVRSLPKGTSLAVRPSRAREALNLVENRAALLTASTTAGCTRLPTGL